MSNREGAGQQRKKKDLDVVPVELGGHRAKNEFDIMVVKRLEQIISAGNRRQAVEIATLQARLVRE